MRLTRIPSQWVGLYVAFVVLSCICSTAQASEGDQSPIYRGCVQECVKNICQPPLGPPKLPLALRLTFWTCSQDCQYNCMQKITAEARDSPNGRIVQYHGKWPFYRLGGIQEPASVLFSVLNGYMHWKHWRVLKQKIPSHYFMKPFYLGWVIIGVNTWVWSAVFHTRDFPLTEKLDYFSAALSILYSLYYAIIRLFYLRSKLLIRAWSFVCIAMYLAHIGYLGLIRFDYGYNIAAGATIGLIHNLLWIAWTIKWYIRDRHAFPSASFERRKKDGFAWIATASVICISLAMALEVFDFPPWFGVLDAHSLWHLSTISLIPIWYTFLIEDSQWEVRVGNDKRRA